jgi:hypothetical protein
LANAAAVLPVFGESAGFIEPLIRWDEAEGKGLDNALLHR